ncbi:hypothetical protein ACFFV7_44135 [Nonomuraea spiralis]|uniref:Uncharacterized protein n=1 Tax=Nonomuraea spiralis TaxID=46182 RepID=A0ABV5IWG3_9ACTN|nr:hypothetical protein [Nonomuraea spiralis]GGS90329.1 hypothetical protein GCM10010176_037610 [Nonomuraea spiralis]
MSERAERTDMGTFKVLWTVLPAGPAGTGEVRLSVAVGPRLEAPRGRLDDVGEFVDWPRTVRETVLPALRIVWDGHADPVVPRPDPRSPVPDSELWGRMFPGASPVRSRSVAVAGAADTAGPPGVRLLRSFPAALVHERIATLYDDIGKVVVAERLTPPGSGNGAAARAEPPSRPWRQPYTGTVRGIPVVTEMSRFTGDPQAAYRAIDGMIGQAGDAAAPYARTSGDRAAELRPATVDRTSDAYRDDETRFALAEALRFYDRPKPAGSGGPAGAEAVPGRPEPPDVEFHGVCGFLADYPELCRRLGLVLDLVVPVPAGLAATGRLRVAFEGVPAAFDTGVLRPWTLFEHVAGERFTAASPPGHPVQGGWLGLGGPDWTVTDADIDGAVIKAADFTALIERMHELTGPSGQPSARELGTGTTALQGAGLTVFHRGRDAWLAAQIGDDAAHQAGTGGTPPELHAGHLVRGFRVDAGIVGPEGAVTGWLSLCRRRGSYLIRRSGQQPYRIEGIADDEGAVRASAVTRDATRTDELYVHQALFGWDGWSLAAPLPGRTLDRFGRPVVADPEVDEHFPLDTKFTPVPGSLPALRYGRAYRLRARVVDLAGNALEPAAEAPASALSQEITYSRWEPVPPPVIVERGPFNEGESSRCLVIRSTVTAAGRDVPAWEWALERQDVPGHTDDPPAADGLSRRYRHFDERFVAPPKTSLQMAERHGRFDDAIGGERPPEVRRRFFAAAAREAGTFLDTVVSHADDPSRTRDLLFFGEIAVAKHDAADPEPLTPLPVTRGAGLKRGEFVVHTAAELILPYLPDVLARGVTLYGLPGAPPIHPVPFYDDFHERWPDAGPFALRIEEGEEEPRWRSFPRRLTVHLPKAEMATVRLSCRLTAADLGLFPVWRRFLHSDFWRDLTDAERALIADETAAGLNWLLTPYIEVSLVHAVERPLTPPELAGLSFVREPDQPFADLRGTLRSHPRSTGHVDVDATWTRWIDDVAEPAPRRIKEHAHVGRVELSYADKDEVRLPHSATPLRHDFGDTLHRNVAYRPTATTRFREYFHPSITADPGLVTSPGESSAGPDGLGWPVPAARRPEPPKPSYLVPTFRWSRRVDRRARRFVRVREGAGVRVYLDRPWFSSGDDELLAVVLDPPAPSGGGPLPGHLATRWGTDPIWSDTTVLPPPAPVNFPGPIAAADGLRLAESGEGRELVAAVVAHEPSYDAAKGLWFADVDVDLGAAGRDSAYFPYLRLALARYQPYALAGLELSPVVQAEFAQLVPRRTLAVEETPDGGLRVTLSGPAAATEFGAQAGPGLPGVAASHRVTATVQRRPFTSDEELDWADTPVRTELTCGAAPGGFEWSAVIPPAGMDIVWQYRLLVEERERYRTDPGTADKSVVVGGAAQPVPVGERLAHVDSAPLRAGLGRLVIDFDG